MITELVLAEVGKSVYSKKEIQNWDEYIIRSQLVGPPGAHSRQNILRKINRFIERQENGEDGQYQLSLPRLSFQQILNMAVEICGICPDPEYTEGEDFVSLEAFKKYTPVAAKVAREVSQKGGTILFATGHPESLPPAYSYIAKCLVNIGASLYNPIIYPIYYEDRKPWLGSICGVTVLFEGGELRHTHNDCGLDKILELEKKRPDLVVADHGMAAAAIRAEIPTIAIIDTNDIELIVAASTYPDRIFPIPMHDNAGPEVSMVMAYYFEHFLKA